MKRIDANTVKTSKEERIFGDVYTYLREEHGKSRSEAMEWFESADVDAPQMLTREYLDYLDDIGQPVIEPVPEGKAPRNAWGGLYADTEGNWFSPEAEKTYMAQHIHLS